MQVLAQLGPALAVMENVRGCSPHDENLGRIFAARIKVTVLELARLVNRRLFAGPEGEAVTDEGQWRELEEQVLASAYETLGCFPEIIRRGIETEIPGIIPGISPGQAGRRGDPRWNRQAGRGKVPGDSGRLRGCGEIPELIPVSSVSPASWGTVKKEVGRGWMPTTGPFERIGPLLCRTGSGPAPRRRGMALEPRDRFLDVGEGNDPTICLHKGGLLTRSTFDREPFG